MKKILLLETYDLISLPRDEQFTLEKGSLWVTYEGDATDYVLKPGESLRTTGRKVILEALEKSEISVTPFNKTQPRPRLFGDKFLQIFFGEVLRASKSLSGLYSLH